MNRGVGEGPSVWRSFPSIDATQDSICLAVLEGHSRPSGVDEPEVYMALRGLSSLVGLGTSAQLTSAAEPRGTDNLAEPVEAAAWDVAEATFHQDDAAARLELQVSLVRPEPDPRSLGSLVLLSVLLFDQVAGALNSVAAQLPPQVCQSGVDRALDGLDWLRLSGPTVQLEISLDQVVGGDSEALSAAAAQRLTALAPAGVAVLHAEAHRVLLRAPESSMGWAPLVNLWGQCVGEVGGPSLGAIRFRAFRRP